MACINVVWHNSIGTRETTEENFSMGKKKILNFIYGTDFCLSKCSFTVPSFQCF